MIIPVPHQPHDKTDGFHIHLYSLGGGMDIISPFNSVSAVQKYLNEHDIVSFYENKFMGG